MGKRYVLFANDHNVAMRYEGLARAAFGNPPKGQDPHGIAMQEVYGFEGDVITADYRKALVIVFEKLVDDDPGNQVLEDLLKRARAAKTQIEAIEIVDEGIAEISKES